MAAIDLAGYPYPDGGHGPPGRSRHSRCRRPYRS